MTMSQVGVTSNYNRYNTANDKNNNNTPTSDGHIDNVIHLLQLSYRHMYVSV